jgi:hypothetical protein
MQATLLQVVRQVGGRCIKGDVVVGRLGNLVSVCEVSRRRGTTISSSID